MTPGLGDLFDLALFQPIGERLVARLDTRIFAQSHQGRRAPLLRDLIVQQSVQAAKYQCAGVVKGHLVRQIEVLHAKLQIEALLQNGNILLDVFVGDRGAAALTFASAASSSCRSAISSARDGSVMRSSNSAAPCTDPCSGECSSCTWSSMLVSSLLCLIQGFSAGSLPDGCWAIAPKESALRRKTVFSRYMLFRNPLQVTWAAL